MRNSNWAAHWLRSALASDKDCMLFLIQIMPVTDIRTDRRTAGFTIDSTAHCIASYADAL